MAHGDDVFVIVNALNVKTDHDDNSDGIAIERPDGEEDHTEDDTEDHIDDLYAESSTDQLYEDIGATKGYQSYHNLNVHQETPALPTSFKKDTVADSDVALRQSEPQSSEEPLMVRCEHAVCAQCLKEKYEDDGRMDENDGCWYCDECWNTFYD